MSVRVEDEEERTSRRLRVRHELAIMLVLGSVVILLGASGIGKFPVPNSTANATVMHVPVILAGVFGGPLAGFGTGFAFGGYSWLDADAPIFANPVVALLPRCAIGIVAWAVFLSLRKSGLLVASCVAAALGSAANTLGVLTLAVAFARFPVSAIPPVIPQALLEMALAVAVVSAVVVAVDRVFVRRA